MAISDILRCIVPSAKAISGYSCVHGKQGLRSMDVFSLSHYIMYLCTSEVRGQLWNAHYDSAHVGPGESNSR